MPQAWVPYRAIVSARFRMLLQYRAAAVGGLWTQIFFGLVHPRDLRSVLSLDDRGAADDLSPDRLLRVARTGADGDDAVERRSDVRAMVRSGAVAYELCRPIDLYGLWYARALAGRTAPTVLRAVPLFLFASLVLPLVGPDEWRLAAPPSLASAIAFAAALAGTLLLGCALSTLINISLLWTISGDGAVILLTTLATFLSGMIVPLPLFPDWAQPIVQALPFAGLIDLPFRLFTGHIPPGAVLPVLRHQLLWTAALVVAGRWLLARGLRRIVVQGG